MTKPIGYYCNHFTDLEQHFGSHLEAMTRSEKLTLMHLLSAWLYAEDQNPANWTIEDVRQSWTVRTTPNLQQAIALLDGNQEADEGDVLMLVTAIASQIKHDMLVEARNR